MWGEEWVTYVPAVTPGKFAHASAVRGDSDSDLSSMIGDVEAKITDWTRAAKPEMHNGRIGQWMMVTDGFSQ